VLPDGMSYRVMVLPTFNAMLPNVLAEIEEQVWKEGEEPHISGLLVPVSI